MTNEKGKTNEGIFGTKLFGLYLSLMQPNYFLHEIL